MAKTQTRDRGEQSTHGGGALPDLPDLPGLPGLTEIEPAAKTEEPKADPPKADRHKAARSSVAGRLIMEHEACGGTGMIRMPGWDEWRRARAAWLARKEAGVPAAELGPCPVTPPHVEERVCHPCRGTGSVPTDEGMDLVSVLKVLLPYAGVR